MSQPDPTVRRPGCATWTRSGTTCSSRSTPSAAGAWGRTKAAIGDVMRSSPGRSDPSAVTVTGSLRCQGRTPRRGACCGCSAGRLSLRWASKPDRNSLTSSPRRTRPRRIRSRGPRYRRAAPTPRTVRRPARSPDRLGAARAAPSPRVPPPPAVLVLPAVSILQTTDPGAPAKYPEHETAVEFTRFRNGTK